MTTINGNTNAQTDTVVVPATGTYRVDPTWSTVTFDTRHLFGLAPVRGSFRLRGGEFRVAEPLADSTARATVDATSFHTGLSARDRTVRSATYLDTANHPDIEFSATGLTRDEDGWVLAGTLTVRGKSGPLSVRVLSVSPARRGELRIRARAKVDRYAFGITAGRGMTGRRLTLTLDLVAR
jgi:polyisoprenoid-binding protein YceI